MPVGKVVDLAGIIGRLVDGKKVPLAFHNGRTEDTILIIEGAIEEIYGGTHGIIVSEKYYSETDLQEAVDLSLGRWKLVELQLMFDR